MAPVNRRSRGLTVSSSSGLAAGDRSSEGGINSCASRQSCGASNEAHVIGAGKSQAGGSSSSAPLDCNAMISMAVSYFTIVFHNAVGILYLYVLTYEVFNVNFPRDAQWLTSKYGGRWQYITHWNSTMLSIYFLFAASIDFAELFCCGEKSTGGCCGEGVHKTRDLYFASVIAPFSLFVVTGFWLIYLIDSEMIYPDNLGSAVPGWVNFVHHTLPLIIVLIDLTIASHCFPPIKQSVFFLTGFSFAYLCWLILARSMNGVWSFKALEYMTTVERILFFGVAMLYMILCYYAARKAFCKFGGRFNTSASYRVSPSMSKHRISSCSGISWSEAR